MRKISLIIFIIVMQFLLISPVFADYHGTVIASADNKTFVIRTMREDQTFIAKNLCYDVREDDNVLFTLSVETCDSNRFVNLRTGETCEVWCK